MRCLLCLAFLCFFQPLFAAGPPIIDMHFYVRPGGIDGPPDHPENLAAIHANPLVYPAVLDLMLQLPGVYVDVSRPQKILPRNMFHNLLRAFDEVGLMGRVIFGSDRDSYGPALEACRTAGFLLEQQIDGVFCRNAARFLRRQEICDR